MIRIIIACLALSGCVSTVGLTSSFCDPRSGIRAIRLSAAEIAALRSDTKKDILAVLKYGEKNCGWKP